MKINWKSVRNRAISSIATITVVFTVLEVSRNSYKDAVKEPASTVDTVATIFKDTTMTDITKDTAKSMAVKK